MDGKALESFLGALIPNFHKHLVYPTNISSKCNACSNLEQRGTREGGYSCKQCNFYVHKDCVEINNLERHKHPLKLLEFIDLHDNDKTCLLCEEKVRWLFYHCFICGFTLCTICTSKPLVIDTPKRVHKHSLTQVMVNNVSFTCDACEFKGDGFPCICLECCFIVHKDCIHLPRVIHINRHDHRVVHTYLLGHGNWNCGVCRLYINGLYGGYSCSICRYAVHSKCGVRKDVWNGVELEDLPEDDDDEDPNPFEVIREGLIKHFSHEHELRLVISIGGNYKELRCYACILPNVHHNSFYTCMKCHFILHETCANFPRIKRHELHNNNFTLYPKLDEDSYGCIRSFFNCYACGRPSTGFRYKSENKELDVQCATISDKFLHGSHPDHSLSIPSLLTKVCSACDKQDSHTLTCVECGDFFLCFKCATIPNEVIHEYDEHILYLRYSGNLHGNYWCEMCEKPINPKKWFYSCDICSSTLHVDCLLGVAPYLKPGQSFKYHNYEFQIVSNNHNISRPFCRNCSSRCVDAIVIKHKNETATSFLCSVKCLESFVASDLEVDYYSYSE